MAIAFVALLAPLHGQTPAGRGSTNAPPEEVRLWEGAPPGALGSAPEDIPTLTIYRANRTGSGTGVVIAPGGSYGALAMDHEGRQVAGLFNAMGVAAFILKYRLGPRYHHPVQLGDAQRAIRLVRARATEFGVEPDRIGIMGFSAGGHLASTAATRFDGGIFENGPHGVGLALGDPALAAWPTLLANWLRGRGLLTRPPAAGGAAPRFAP